MTRGDSRRDSGRDPDRYRPNVGLALFHADGLVFLGRRAGASGPYQWQMPQGGVDRGETPAEAALRELEEEIGIDASLVDVLEETSDWLYYDFPDEIRARESSRGRYLGQRQKWFALRFKGRDADVHLDRHKPEFSDWRWGRLEEAPSLVIPFKRAVYEDVAHRFKRYAGGTQRTKADG
jgi:putative (di)nucleoside polyphosphate hydrolase